MEKRGVVAHVKWRVTTEEFRTRCSNLIQQIDSLPRTGIEVDDDSRNALKENAVSLSRIDEQVDQLLYHPDQKEELKKLEMQLDREWLSIVRLWHMYGRERGDFGDGFRNASAEANNLVEVLKKALKDAKKGGHKSSLIR